MVHNNILDKVLDKIKKIIGYEKLDDTKFFIDTDDKLSDNVTLKNVVMLITCVIKNDDNIYPQLL